MKNLRKLIKIILIILGLLLTINGVFISFFSNLNLGVILTICLGIFLLIYGIAYDRIQEYTSGGGVKKAIRYIVVIGMIFFAGVISIIVFYGSYNTTEFNEDAVVILGCGIHGEKVSAALKYRLDNGVRYYERNDDAIIVVSGGQGPQEDITEALAMKRYLVNKGVSPDDIIMEDRATSTYENFKYSKEILDKYFKNTTYSITYITNNFHSYRAGQYAKQLGYDANSYSSNVDGVLMVSSYIRESLAVLKYWVIDSQNLF